MVKPPTYLSDHCLIALNIFNFKNSKEINKEELWSLPGTFKWTNQSKDIYIDALLEENSVEDILFSNKLIDDNNFNDIDFLVTKTNEIYLEAAKKSVSFKANFKKSIMQRHTKKAKPKKVWMSNDCLLLRKEVRSLGNRLAKAPDNNALRLTYCNLRCELGTLPISIKCYQLMYKYYVRLSDIGERYGGPHEILKAAFEVDKTLTNRENPWSNKLSELLKYIGIPLNKHCNSNFKQKLEDFYKNKIIFELSKIKDENCGKLLFFSKIYTKFKQQDYLNFNVPKYLRKNSLN
ncbi:unnamed protein product [Mytilus coruscus]|uniref:Uncharacterized protein n=1 Tax=Mytilus coruscus TaxID=42192 RepID=A0A6J8B3U8_MYTCO|nr:unnamed protein product [Mytilus coruscus]